MNGPSAYEQSIRKVNVTTLDKVPENNSDDNIPQTSSITDESGCTSRFQMIRVDRNFGRGRWKVNDYEPPENISSSTFLPVNTIENDPITMSNNPTFSNVTTTTVPDLSATIPTLVPGDSNATTLAATAAVSFSYIDQKMSYRRFYF